MAVFLGLIGVIFYSLAMVIMYQSGLWLMVVIGATLLSMYIGNLKT